MHKILLVSDNQEKTVEYLEKFKKENKINQNYLTEISPLKEEIVLSQIKDLKKELLITLDKERWIIFYNFEKANIESQNALLKTIEEATKNNFVFITNNQYKILPTLRSRLKIIDIKNSNDIYTTEEIDLCLAIDRSPLQHLKTVSKLDRQESVIFLDKLLFYYQKKLAEQKRNCLIIKKILTIRRLIQDNNLNCQLALDNLLIFIYKTPII